MTRRLTLLSLTLLLLATGCSSEKSLDSGATIASVAGATTTVAVVATTTTADAGAPSTESAPPSTPAPTVALPPASTPCREVGSIYGLSDVSGVDVRRGDCGEGVKNVQSQLNVKLGISLAIDGLFGPGTETAVRDFQAQVGLAVDGIVGPNTWVALTDDGT